MSYTNVFGGGVIYPSDDSYSLTVLSANTTLYWPTEIGADPVACALMDVDPTISGLRITLPDARLVSVGENIIFNNVGSFTFSVNKSDGTQVASVATGKVWLVYLIDNTTAAGTWRVVQYGASTSASSAGALAGAGLTAVGSTLSQNIPVFTINSNYLATTADLAAARVWTGGAGTISLNSAGSLGGSWFMHVRNQGTGVLTIAPTLPNLIDGETSLSLQPDESCIVIGDGLNFYTIGRGKSATSSFTFLTVPVSGIGTQSLTSTQYKKTALRFTGALVGSQDIVVPSVVGQYWIDNQTTGAFPLTVKTSAGTGITVSQGTRMILYCDGTNVVDAVSLGTLGGVVAVSQGGTGATTGPAALINLGGTSLGVNLFTSASPALARGALGVSVVGDAVFSAATPQVARAAIDAISEDEAIVYALAFG